MNEQVVNILAENVTKTEKIRKLLLLGLTRRQVADLVTNGNYGFVQNVYKKMLDHIAPASVTTTNFNYIFNRRFGIEIEGYNCTRRKLSEELRSAGINVAVEDYNHDTRGHWKLTTDSSLHGDNTFELVSPILEGESGLIELEKVCLVLDFCNVKVNNSCGLHIHMDAENFTLDTWKNLAITYKNLERTIDAFMPISRRQNSYCKGLGNISTSRIMQARSITELRAVFNNDRYKKINLESYPRHRTVEFRQHSGTICFSKMKNWILFLGRMITFARQSKIESLTGLDNIPFLEEGSKLYYSLRTRKLNNNG